MEYEKVHTLIKDYILLLFQCTLLWVKQDTQFSTVVQTNNKVDENDKQPTSSEWKF